jgi:competence protein ComEC
MRLVYLALGWCAGIVLAANSSNHLPTAWLGLSALALIALWFSRHHPIQRSLMIILLAATLGGLRFALTPAGNDLVRFNLTGGLTIQGVIAEAPDIRDDRMQVRVRAETLTQGGHTYAVRGDLLVQASRGIDVGYGDRIRATGHLITPAQFDTFSYADYLARGGIFSIMPNAAVTPIAFGEGSPLTAALLDVKDRAGRAIGEHLPEPASGLLRGILLGDERGIAPQLEDDFARTGAAHLIAISGFNMIIISSTILKLLLRLRVSPRGAAAAAAVVIVIYSLFVGANPAVLRAALMSVLLVSGQIVRRRGYVPASLAFAALILSALNPTVLWDVSFQLSFFATLGLALFADPLSARFDRLLGRLLAPKIARRVGDFLTEPLIVSLAAQIMVTPLIALYFGRVSLVSLPVNLLVVPIQAPLLILGGLATLTAVLLPFAAALAQVLFWFDLVLLSWTIGVVRAFARFPLADVTVSIDPRLVALFFTVIIGWAIMHATQPDWLLRLARLARSRATTLATAFAGAAILILTGALIISRPDGQLHLWVLDVGHSNGVLIQTPGGAHILVDGGPYPSRLLTALGDRLPFNDRTLEVIAITQPDPNDYGALPSVLTRYQAGLVLTNGQPNLSDSFAELEAAIAPYNVLVVQAGYTLEFGDGVVLEVLAPLTAPGLSDEMDDGGLVLRLRYGEVSFLLPSDLSLEGQAALLETSYMNSATVLQIPKHGAAYGLSDDFLGVVAPQMAVVQADAANRRGEPNPDTLAQIGDLPIYRTDRGGTVHFQTNGVEIAVTQER